jgi:hypothetical protein
MRQFLTAVSSRYISSHSALVSKATCDIWPRFPRVTHSLQLHALPRSPSQQQERHFRSYFTLTCRVNGLETNLNTPLCGILLRFNPARKQDLRISTPLGQATGFLLKEGTDNSKVWCASQRIRVRLCEKLPGCKYGILLRTDC